MKRQHMMSHSDKEVLHQLWRWKALTTAAIAKLCYPELSLKTVSKRLWFMERDELIECRTTNVHRSWMWTLGKIGFADLLESLPELKDMGYKPEHLVHDLVTSAVHIGDQVFGPQGKIEVFSEQEMRRHHKEFYPDWVPRSERHRADGYWLAHGIIGPFTVALEVERFQKSDLNYEIIADFYASEPKVKRVVWLSPSQGRSHALHRRFTEALRGRPMIHTFLDYPSFLKSGWNAKFIRGADQGQSLGFLLGVKPECLQNFHSSNILLDVRKAPYSSGTWRPLSEREFSN